MGKGLEVLGGVIVAGAGHADVFRYHGLAFLFELLGENALQRLEANAHHAERRAQRERVLGDLVAGDIREFRNRKRTKLHAGGGRTRLDGLFIEDAGGARAEQAEVAVHGVLIQGNEQVNAVPHIRDFFRAGANG